MIDVGIPIDIVLRDQLDMGQSLEERTRRCENLTDRLLSLRIDVPVMIIPVTNHRKRFAELLRLVKLRIDHYVAVLVDVSEPSVFVENNRSAP